MTIKGGRTLLYRFLCSLLVAVGMLCQPWASEASGITNYPPLVNPDYWVKQNGAGDKLVLDAAGVQSLNAKIRAQSRTMWDMTSYPATYSGDALRTRIMDYQALEDDLYLNGNKVSENYKNILRAQTNTKAIPNVVNVRYAVTITRAAIRNLPTGQGLFYYAGDKEFDVLQETTLDPGEPVAILHQSENTYFYYVQSYNYSGWISRFNVALTDKKTWLQFAAPKDFLLVTDAKYAVKFGKNELLYQQGARLPLVDEELDLYTVEVPTKLPNGNLHKQKITIPKISKAVHKGYLPYTTNNIIRSAFKFYGMPYGWGGLKESVDCSSLILNAYRTVGIYLPRNTDQQANTAGITKQLLGLDNTKKTELIKGLAPGAALYMDGHGLMYLGQINGTPYCIHALGSHFINGSQRREMQVVVSDLTLKRSSGNSFLEDLYAAKEFK